MKSYEDYYNDPEIAGEPKALREIHAIRLEMYDRMRNMGPEERSALIQKETEVIISEYGLEHLKAV